MIADTLRLSHMLSNSENNNILAFFLEQQMQQMMNINDEVYLK